MITNTQKVVETLQRWPGLDDDKLAYRANIQTRQQVNQICHRLKAQGRLRRTPGPDGKMINELISSAKPAEATQRPVYQEPVGAIELTMKLAWTVLGHVELDQHKKLTFPKAPTQPGLYKFEFITKYVRKEYIGETDRLSRRLQHYRTPGPSQSTNIRLNRDMIKAIESGYKIGVSIMSTDASIMMDGQTCKPDMLKKSVRVLLEHAAIYAARKTGIVLLNLDQRGLT